MFLAFVLLEHGVFSSVLCLKSGSHCLGLAVKVGFVEIKL